MAKVEEARGEAGKGSERVEREAGKGSERIERERLERVVRG